MWPAPRRPALLTALTALTIAALGSTLSGCDTGGSAAGHSPAASPSGDASERGASANSPGDGFSVAAEHAKPGTRAWSLPQRDWASDTELAGFVDHDSIRPGTPLELKVTSTLPTFTATAYRMGWYGGTGARQVWSSAPLTGVQQPKPALRQGNMVDATNWPTTTTISTTGWLEGLYLIKLSGGGKGKYIPLTVRSADARGRVVLVNATTTYQAYNAYGGYSLYTGPAGFADRARRVSFDRPYDRSGARLVTAGERQVTALAEKLGLPVAYLTQSDVDRQPSLVTGARGLVSLSHDEYWSVPMRDAWEQARDAGTNLAFLGANSSYWRIRTTDAGRVVVGYKSAADDPVQGKPDTTAMWRSAPDPRPENSLTGQLYECFPARGPLVVTDPGFFLFAGTGARAGSRYHGLIGVEIDRAYPIKGTPPTLQVAAHSPVQCGQLGPTFSDLTYYTAPGGAGVIATGSMGFAIGVLGTNAPQGIDQPASDFATTFTTNLLRAMAAGPMGKAHPARPNLAGLNPPPSTTTGSGGAVAGLG